MKHRATSIRTFIGAKDFEASKQFYTELGSKYERVKLTPIKEYDWEKECFMHDPSGVLWHFGEFYQNQKNRSRTLLASRNQCQLLTSGIHSNTPIT